MSDQASVEQRKHKHGVLSINSVIAYNLRRARLSRGWTQEELADRLLEKTGRTWTKATVGDAERSIASGRTRRFDANEITAFALTFDLPITYFFTPPEGDDGPEHFIAANYDDADYRAFAVGVTHEELKGVIYRPRTDEEQIQVATTWARENAPKFRNEVIHRAAEIFAQERSDEVVIWFREAAERHGSDLYRSMLNESLIDLLPHIYEWIRTHESGSKEDLTRELKARIREWVDQAKQLRPKELRRGVDEEGHEYFLHPDMGVQVIEEKS